MIHYGSSSWTIIWGPVLWRSPQPYADLLCPYIFSFTRTFSVSPVNTLCQAQRQKSTAINPLPSTEGNHFSGWVLGRGMTISMRADVHRYTHMPVYTHCVFHNYTYKQTNIDPGRLKMAAVVHYWSFRKINTWFQMPLCVCVGVWNCIYIISKSYVCHFFWKWHNHSKSTRNFRFW